MYDKCIFCGKDLAGKENKKAGMCFSCQKRDDIEIYLGTRDDKSCTLVYWNDEKAKEDFVQIIPIKIEGGYLFQLLLLSEMLMSEELVDKFPDANALLCNVIPDIVYSALKK